MDKREEIVNKIQEVISSGDTINGKKLINQYKDNIGIDDEIESMESVINFCEGNYKEALLNVREGLKYNIFNSDLYFTMGNIYEALSEYNRAYLCYEQSLYLCKDESIKDEINLSINKLKESYDVKVNKVSFVILTCNQLKYTKLCIDSIRQFNNKNTYEIIIVDNNSTDGTVKWLKNQEDIKVIYNDKNEGFPKGCNQGIEIASKDNDIMLLNNDTVLMINSIFNLRLALYSNDNVGAAGSVSNCVSYYQQIDETFTDLNDYIKYARKNNIADESSYEQRIKLVGFAMLIKRKVLDKIGYLDERFTPGNFEDDDISLRIIMEGYKLLLCKDSYIHHFGSITFRENSEKYNELINKNSIKFRDKWGFSMQYSSFIRNDIISLIEDDAVKPIRVLEIGCACGATLLKIKDKYKNAEIYGIELNDNSAKIAKCFADVRAENIENAKLSYEEGFFDYIIFADVLKHLFDPKLVINNMKKYLKKDGYMLASIPNVMHYSVIKDLLYGNWTYADSGILDRTHVRFFTQNEIVRLFNEAKYKIDCVRTINMGISKEDSEFVKKLMEIKNVADEYQFMTYQYLVKVSKK